MERKLKLKSIFKANLAGQGYTLLSSEAKPPLSLEEFDELIPKIESGSPPLPIVYVVKKLTPYQVFWAVGVHWRDHQDQFGRSGLSFWHGVVCDVLILDERSLIEIADLVIGLVNRYEVGYVSIGRELVQTIAIESQPDQWLKTVSQWSEKVPSKVTPETEKLALAFWKDFDWRNDHINLRISLPYHPYVAVPCLIGAMLKSSPRASIAGGSLAEIRLERFNFVSTNNDLFGFSDFYLTNSVAKRESSFRLPGRILSPLNDAVGDESTPTRKTTQIQVFISRRRKLFWFIIVLLLAFMFIALKVLWPLISSSWPFISPFGGFR